jgi:glycosyltransferase involved in cell wall biosynthesis
VPTKVYGNKNEDSGELSGGYLTYDAMKDVYRSGSVYFYTGTQPAAYTLNFIEAFLTGIPIVAIGEKFANSLGIAGNSYEVQEILESEDSLGFVGQDIPALKHYIELVYNNRVLAERISQNARRKAIQLFGKQTVKQAWKNYLHL